MPLDYSLDPPLTSVTRQYSVIYMYLIIVKVSFYINVLLYVYKIISCGVHLVHLSMFVICIYSRHCCDHYENWYIKYKWFCG